MGRLEGSATGASSYSPEGGDAEGMTPDRFPERGPRRARQWAPAATACRVRHRCWRIPRRGQGSHWAAAARRAPRASLDGCVADAHRSDWWTGREGVARTGGVGRADRGSRSHALRWGERPRPTSGRRSVRFHGGRASGERVPRGTSRDAPGAGCGGHDARCHRGAAGWLASRPR